MHDFISVILPAFNAESTIVKTIYSLKKQVGVNFEIIVVDDGSSDSTAKLVQDVIDKKKADDCEVRIIKTSNNGPSVARKIGINNSKGNYIALADSDDLYTADRLLSQLKYLKKNDLDLCGTNVVTFGRGIPKIWRYPETHSAIEALSFFNSPLANPVAFGRKKIFQSVIELNTVDVAEDYNMWVSLLIQGAKFGNLQKTCLYYRVHKKQISTEKRDLQAAARTRIAKKYWENKYDYVPAISSFYRIEERKDVDEIVKMIDIYSSDRSGYTALAKIQIYKMILRSRMNKNELLSDFASAGLKFPVVYKLFAMSMQLLKVRFK